MQYETAADANFELTNWNEKLANEMNGWAERKRQRRIENQVKNERL